MSEATAHVAYPTSGLLPALVGYYERLEADEDVRDLAPPGFSREKIHAELVLEADGTIAAFNDIREHSPRGKLVPRSLLVPMIGSRQGTGMLPLFCWDNTGYALGRDTKGKPERAERMFAAFRDLHLSARAEVGDDEPFEALCGFLGRWNPADAESLPGWEELAGQNLVFKLRGRQGYVYQSPAVRRAWLHRVAAEQAADPRATVGPSLVDGEVGPLERTHAKIKGLPGQTTGGAIISFNEPAYKSYGKSKSYNAPVGVNAAFKYATALNRLLADNARRLRIGDATVVFWADAPPAAAKEATDWFGQLLGESGGNKAESDQQVDRLRESLVAVKQGRMPGGVSGDTPFYVLGLMAPSVARIYVRFWLPSTLGALARRLVEHHARLEMVGENDDPPVFTISDLLDATVPIDKVKNKPNREKIAPQLAGQLSRSVLEGLPYPRMLLDAVVRRIRISANIDAAKAAILKACLIQWKVTTMDSHLYKNHPVPAYHCGRMFAVLAFAQEEALENVKAGIVRRNFASAMAVPGLVLGRLQRNAEIGHIPKLEGKGDLVAFIRDEMQSISVAIGYRMPHQLDLTRQSIFGLGYYQQRAYLAGVRDRIRRLKKGQRMHRSGRGEWMASRLEVTVADVLTRHDITYVYEVRAVLPTGPERMPDFFIERAEPSMNVYLEVLGYGGQKYDADWEAKVAGYRDIGITAEGGARGRLAVLDWRNRWGSEPKTKPMYPDDAEVLEVLRPHIPLPTTTPQAEIQTGQGDSDE